jgi:hypothetical protein
LAGDVRVEDIKNVVSADTVNLDNPSHKAMSGSVLHNIGRESI